MRPIPLVIGFTVTLVVAACSGAGSTSAPSVATSASPTGGATAQRIELKLTDALKMEPAQIAVRAGQPVTFVVTNTGGIDHEFYLGDEAAQQAHEMDMMSSMGPMSMDESLGFTVKPGETKELTHTFEKAGEMLAGCHVAGHYPAGMKMTIAVTE